MNVYSDRSRNLPAVDQSTLDVTYFSLSFPELSQTFVFNEMRGLRNEGANVRIVALKLLEDGVSDLPAKYGFSDAVTYVFRGNERQSKFRRMLNAVKAVINGRASLMTVLKMVLHRSRGSALSTSLKLQLAAQLQPKGHKSLMHCHFGTAGRVAADLKMHGLVDGPLSVVFHGFDITQYLKDKPADTYKNLFEQADFLLPISDLWHRRLIELGAPRDKITTLRLGIDCNAFQFRERMPRADEPLRFISVGRMTEKKGHRFAVEAFAQFVKRRPDLDMSLDIVGAGPLYEDIKALADEFAMGDRLKLHGSVQHDEVRRLLDHAHVFVLPSLTAENGDMEGIPVAIMEAMALGLAVISTHHSGIPELVADGKSGILVPERDVEALSTAMETLCSEPAKISTMGEEGRKIVETSYNEKVQAKALKELLSSTV